ncbi:methylated-DNA--[protein]-cysteine S-methyltransferase [Aquibacillus rhizosphaerae]|uniref:Methylated-DNA--protein-cysteine methyltransferase n=1 Tax=Aquibacillus rhizosphaerae TaxID=3051431 RepID=A0ABT7L3H4_9BACI|nr:methylated-DNA--[protein]-cysteine S-methyltransferase [Aquibacillus sp. LR5S19]MDL4840399.1 methylated-DNA--[protein]-cysteine S-methyltransferase [Aquibacillus sp. LR5S19]
MGNQSYLYYDEMETPVGPLTIIMTNKGLCRIDFGEMKQLSSVLHTWSKRFFLSSSIVKDPSRFDQVKKQLIEYFQEERQEFSIDYHLLGTPFQQKVWEALIKEIPYGETRSYKDVAKCIQAPKAIRAVGGAINKNPLSIIIPCHRVIGSNGALVGYNGGMEKKKHLLRLEKTLV